MVTRQGDKVVTPGTTLELSEWEQIKEKKWKLNELIRLGMKSKEDNPQLLARLHNLETENVRMTNNITKYQEKVQTLIIQDADQRKRIEELEKGAGLIDDEEKALL